MALLPYLAEPLQVFLPAFEEACLLINDAPYLGCCDCTPVAGFLAHIFQAAVQTLTVTNRIQQHVGIFFTQLPDLLRKATQRLSQAGLLGSNGVAKSSHLPARTHVTGDTRTEAAV